MVYISTGGRSPHAFTETAHECLERHQEPSPRSGRFFVGRFVSLSPRAVMGPGTILVFGFDFAGAFPSLLRWTSVRCDRCRLRGSYRRWRSRTARRRRDACAEIKLIICSMNFPEVFIHLAQRNLCAFQLVRSYSPS